MNPRRRITLTVAAAVLATGTVAVAPLTPVGPDAPVADAAGAPIASLPSDNPANWTPNVQDGQVNTIWQIGNTVLIGGTFTQIADSTLNGGTVYDQAYLAAFDATTGLVDADFDPVLSGEVEAIVPSADPASFYVAGDFNQVDGVNRRKIARLTVADGSIVTAFKTDGTNGLIRDLRLVDGTLYASGLFTQVEGASRTYIVSLDPTTGDVTSKLNLTVSGLHNGGTGKVIKMDATPDGDKLLITGNFTSIDGQSRPQVALIDIGNTPATLSPWQTTWYTSTCASVFDSYMRDLDISEDGTYAVISTTGAYRPQPSACDTISRFELTDEVADIDPTWVSVTGGDTTYAVEVHDGVAYVGGHMRWLNNPFSSDRHGAGGVARPGMGALDVETGLPYSWNPTRDRGVGLFDYHVTEQGIWAGSDTDRWKNELRMKLAFFPFPGTTVLAPTIGDLPGDVYVLGRSTGTTGNVDQTVLYRVNAGGPTLTSVDDGPDWQSDLTATGFHTSGSQIYTAPSSLATPQNNSSVPKSDLDRAPAALWTTERWDPAGGNPMQWDFPVPNGTDVTVRLYFANRCPCTDNSNQRQFDVSVEGVLRLDDFDLSNQVGHDVGTMRAYDVTSDGNIDIDFAHGPVDNPLIQGIEIISRDVSPSGTLGSRDNVRKLAWNGSGAPTETAVANTTVPWRTVRGAFLASASLYTFHLDGSVTRRTFNGTTFGAGSAIDVWSNNFMADAPNMTGVFFDPATSTVYYTVGNEMVSKQFVAESGVLHAVRTTVALGGTNLDPADVRGMFLSDGRLYFASESDGGDMHSIAWNSAAGLPTGGVQDHNTGTDWRGQAMFLASASGLNTPPTADAALVGCEENVCDFDGTASADPGGTIVSYEWDFGDGSLVGTGATTSHAYDVGDTYTVTLTVTDDLGAVDTDTVVVNPSDPSNVAPIADATATCTANVCQFDGTGSTDSDGTIESYLWNFRDGSSSTLAKPSHAYTAAGTYEVELTVTDDDGATATTDVSVTVTDPPEPPVEGPGPIVPLTPARLLETRVGPTEKTVDGQFQGGGIVKAGKVVELTVTGRGSVPGNADAVMLNVTAILPIGPGYLTVYPCGTTRPLASTVNYQAGQVVANAALAKVGTGGKVCIYTLTDTHIVADVTGYVPDGGSPATLTPARLLETRVGPTEKTVDGQFQGGGIVKAGKVVELTVTGRGSVPGNADAVMLNVTAILPIGPGYLTVYPCGTTRPLASTVNYQTGQVVANAALAKVGTGGKVCIYTLTDTHIVVDVTAAS